MKLSLVFELLLIFVLLAFAASKSVKNQKHNTKKVIQNRNDGVKVEDNSINKYCKCVEAYCNCCREFNLPVVELNGPGCASLMYLNGDKMAVSLSFGKKVITNRTLSSRKPSPVCMPLPGGVSKFCGRVYNIARAGEEFRACLGLELQSKSTVEAAVRVSCFKFGPRGVTSEPADPLPLVPQSEKAEDDDDDDYEDEVDFGLVSDDEDSDDDDDTDDDDDDDDDASLDAVNDVGGVDYAGFSLIDEDLLGELFGSSGGKKSNKNKNKKKQAPPPSTTTTRRPRPSRPRPTRRPSTRSTTPRPTRPIRTTTVRVRPTTGNRRPTRRPTRRPSRRSTTPKITTAALITTTPTTPVTNTITTSIQTTERNVLETSVEQTFEPIVIQRPTASVSETTDKGVSELEDPGLKMSLAHITGQLSSLHVTPIISKGKDSNIIHKERDPPNYEKILTITPKPPTTIPMLNSIDELGDDMVEIGHNHEDSTEPEPIAADETRAYEFGSPVPDNYFEGLMIPKKKNRDSFKLVDLDVLDLTQIGETLGDELGIFGKNKRQHRDNKDTKVQGEKQHSNEYDEIIDTIGDSLMLRKSGNNKRDRRRQNKMMRGEWSHV